ncbi:unnamed protein product [marine sediment metagenome]|uniref:Histone H1 n=1 Tax=marine sediment metagenome TaxID=412755 RepID=X1RZU9_9ZZZZ
MEKEKDDFEGMIKRLNAVIQRDGIESKSGGSAARQIAKIRTIKKIKREAKKIQERLKKGYGHIHINA